MRISKLLKTTLAFVLTVFVLGTRSPHAVGAERITAKAEMTPVAFAGHVRAFLSEPNPSLNDMHSLLGSFNLADAAKPENKAEMEPILEAVQSVEQSLLMNNLSQSETPDLFGLETGKVSPKSLSVQVEFLTHPLIWNLIPMEDKPVISQIAVSARKAIKSFALGKIKRQIAGYFEETQTPDPVSDLGKFPSFQGRNPMEVVVARAPGGLFASKQEALSRTGLKEDYPHVFASFVPTGHERGLGLVRVSYADPYSLYQPKALGSGHQLVPFAHSGDLTDSYLVASNNFISAEEIRRGLVALMKEMIQKGEADVSDAVRYFEETQTPDLVRDLESLPSFRGRNPMDVVVARIPGGLFASKGEALSATGLKENSPGISVSFVPTGHERGLGLVRVSYADPYSLYQPKALGSGHQLMPFAHSEGLTDSYLVAGNNSLSDQEIRRGLVALIKEMIQSGEFDISHILFHIWSLEDLRLIFPHAEFTDVYFEYLQAEGILPRIHHQ